MKALRRIAWILAVLSSLPLQAATHSQKFPTLPHLDPEMTGAEYRSILAKKKIAPLSTDSLSIVLDTGKRNLDFFDYLNSLRAPADKMELWTEANTIAYPMNAPSLNNRDIIRGKYDTIMRTMPSDLNKVLAGTGSFPNTAGIPDNEYLDWARQLDRAYQSASRWLLMEPYLALYAQRAEDDVRGYVFFRDDPSAVAKLPGFDKLPAKEQDDFKKSLTQVCMNSGKDKAGCTRELQTSITAKTVANFYSKYLPSSKAKWDEFFDLGAVRSDIRWTASTDPEAFIPFNEPATQEIHDWLRDNIQDEWKWAGWQLKLDFKTSGNNPNIVFVPGATAHVNGLGGNQVTMDANRNIQHYSQKWIIRHEFGHVLGFPDCYAEFYDDSDRVMVNYQLDITNLMCSRRGKLQEAHFLEMKKHYKK